MKRERKFYKDYLSADVVPIWELPALIRISEYEKRGFLIVFHLKKCWWDFIRKGGKDREYRGDRWDEYLEPFRRKMLNGYEIFIELDCGYPRKIDFERKMFFRVKRLTKEISKEYLGGNGNKQWAIHLGERIL